MALQDKLIDALGRFATTFNSYRVHYGDQIGVYYPDAV